MSLFLIRFRFSSYDKAKTNESKSIEPTVVPIVICRHHVS